MKHLLMVEELRQNVERRLCPGTTHSSYEKGKRKAVSTLVIGIQSNLIYLVTSCTTPNDLNYTLNNQLERNILANKLFLKRQYLTTKIKRGTFSSR